MDDLKSISKLLDCGLDVFSQNDKLDINDLVNMYKINDFNSDMIVKKYLNNGKYYEP